MIQAGSPEEVASAQSTWEPEERRLSSLPSNQLRSQIFAMLDLLVIFFGFLRDFFGIVDCHQIISATKKPDICNLAIT